MSSKKIFFREKLSFKADHPGRRRLFSKFSAFYGVGGVTESLFDAPRHPSEEFEGVEGVLVVE